MEWLIALIIGWVIGHRVATFLQVMAFKRVLEDLGISEQQMRDLALKNGIEIPEQEEPQMSEHEITVEQHGGQLYAFKTDGEFIGQGKDKEALVARIAERFKNVRFTVKEGSEFLKDPTT